MSMFVCGMGNSCMYFTACKAKHEVKRPCGRSNPALGDYEEQPTIKPTKTPRKRSAPLYGELLNERELLKIENHNMRLEIQSLRMANEGLRNRLTGYDTASLSKLAALWFRNRKGGGK